MDSWGKRSPLVWPSGVRAGYDSTHVALTNCILRHSSIATFGTSTASGGVPCGGLSLFPVFQKALTKTSTSAVVSAGVDAIIGPYLTTTAGGNNGVSFANQPAITDTSSVLACIFRTGTIGTHQFIAGNSDTGSPVGLCIDLATTGVISVGQEFGTLISTGVTAVANTPYFMAFSITSGKQASIVVNLQSGQITQNTAATAITINATNGTVDLLNYNSNSTSFGGRIAAFAWLSGFLGLPQLRQWAADPWSFWYPQPEDNFVGVIASTAKWLPTAGGYDIEKLPPLKLNPDEPRAQAFRFQPAVGPPAIWLPLTGEEDRPPNPNRVPSADQFFPWFVRSPNPVPTTWLPTTGEEDRPPNPNRIPSPDQFFPWFVRSPNPVPTTWLPLTGQEDRPPPIKRPPDEPWAFYRSPASFLKIWLPLAGEQDHPVPFKPCLEYPSFVLQPPTAARTTPSVWWAVGQDGYIKPIPRPPDDPYPWFVQSPDPVPNTWLPVSYPDGVYWPFKPNDAQQYPWFIEPPLLQFYAQTNADDFNPLKAFQWGESPTTIVFKPPVTPTAPPYFFRTPVPVSVTTFFLM